MQEELTCGECGTGFQRRGARGPVPTRCSDCKARYKRERHAARERARQERRAQGAYVCGHCQQTKPGDQFAPSQRADGRWCRDCYRATYTERSGGLITKQCANCGEDFQVTRRNVRQEYCKPACKDAAAQARKSARLLEAKRGRLCANCGGEISPTKMANARYCDDACRREHVGAEIRRRSMLKRLYGLTPACYDRLVEQQDGRCAICRTDEPGAKGIWYVDHCHDTGKVRGLLCSPCNTGLGQFRDSPDLLRAAINYLDGTA